MDQETNEYYERHAASFAERTRLLDMSALRDRFTALLPPGGRILDAGCGSGRDALAFREAGFDVCAIDGSAQMCAQAEAAGIRACCLTFDEVCGEGLYDGIWASASLLHVPRENLPAVLRRFHRALRPGGVLYASFKKGSGEERRDGRLFADYTGSEICRLIASGGLFRAEAFETADVRPEQAGRPWVNVMARALPADPDGLEAGNLCIF